MFTVERRKGPTRIRFEWPLQAWIMPPDGSLLLDCQVIELSEGGAQLKISCADAKLPEFFLFLTRFGLPVFRRCQTKWVSGNLTGVTLRKVQDPPEWIATSAELKAGMHGNDLFASNGNVT